MPRILSPEDLEAIGQVVRAELRACGIRPPAPPGLAHRWDTERDQWVTPPDEPGGAAAAAGA